jgi:hypothetical protein
VPLFLPGELHGRLGAAYVPPSAADVRGFAKATLAPGMMRALPSSLPTLAAPRVRLALAVALGLVPAVLAAQSAPDTLLPVAGVRLSPDFVQVQAGDTLRFSATAYDSSGAPLSGVPFVWGAAPDLLGAVDSVGVFVGTAAMDGLVLAKPVQAEAIGVARVRVLPLPPAEIRIHAPERIMAGSYVVISASGVGAHGAEAPLGDVVWTSSAPSIATVENGRLLAKSPGSATLTAREGDVAGTLRVRVTPNRAAALEIVCGACLAEVHAEEGTNPPGAAAGAEPGIRRVVVGDAVRLEARAPGLKEAVSPRWWLEGGEGLLGPDGDFVAQASGRFAVMAQFGRLSARLILEAAPRGPGGVLRLVGRGPVANPRVSDLWAFEGVDGRDYVYTGSIGGDQVKVWDVTDPSRPVQTDSLVVDARVINDVNLNQTARLGVLTREGASNRKNGIVLFDASDPAHPKLLSEYTETLTSGVHNAFFDGDYIYCTNDGTRALHVISARDPLHPVEVARWEIRPGQPNKYLHDVFVKDGLAYLSYWDDGLVILDVGNGVKGGAPDNPVFVSRIAYPEGHTHTAWRWKDYVFTTDEIFGGPPVTAEGGVPAGFLHVIDVSDLENPVQVAWFEVPDAGSHNMWMDEASGILYVSYYNAGVRALDVSGRLMGDLRKQGRELAYFLTGEPDATRAAKPNAPMNWGPQLYKGNVFSTDMNSGLWVLRYESLAGITR